MKMQSETSTSSSEQQRARDGITEECLSVRRYKKKREKRPAGRHWQGRGTTAAPDSGHCTPGA